jgi:hypothetical protein
MKKEKTAVRLTSQHENIRIPNDTQHFLDSHEGQCLHTISNIVSTAAHVNVVIYHIEYCVNSSTR